MIWRLVVEYARQIGLDRLAPHDLRRTCAKLSARTGGSWSRSPFCWDIARFRQPSGIWGRSRTGDRSERWYGARVLGDSFLKGIGTSR